MDNKLGIIGIGNIGSMLLNKFLETEIIKEENIYISNRSEDNLNKFSEKYPKLNICKSNIELASICKNIIICAEPLNVPNIMIEIKKEFSEKTHIMVSTTLVLTKDLEKIHKGKITVFMPTLISLVNEGITLAYYNDFVREEDKKFFEKLMSSISRLNILSEDDIKLSQNLTACFPGFFAEIMSELVASVSKYSKNITRKELEQMILSSLVGAPKMIIENNMTFDEAVNKVSTKGGITYEGVKVFKEKLPDVFDCAILSAKKRYEEINDKVGQIIDEMTNS